MKLVLFSLALIPTTFAVAIGTFKEPSNELSNEPSDELSNELSNLLSNEPSNESNDILPPINVDFQTNKVMEMEALNYITNLTNTLISEVTQYAKSAGLSVEDLISFPCTPAPAKKVKRHMFRIHPMWHRLGVKLARKYKTKTPFIRVFLRALKHILEDKSDVNSHVTNSTVSTANSTVSTTNSTIYSNPVIKVNSTTYSLKQ